MPKSSWGVKTYFTIYCFVTSSEKNEITWENSHTGGGRGGAHLGIIPTLSRFFLSVSLKCKTYMFWVSCKNTFCSNRFAFLVLIDPHTFSTQFFWRFPKSDPILISSQYNHQSDGEAEDLFLPYFSTLNLIFITLDYLCLLTNCI